MNLNVLILNSDEQHFVRASFALTKIFIIRTNEGMGIHVYSQALTRLDFFFPTERNKWEITSFSWVSLWYYTTYIEFILCYKR